MSVIVGIDLGTTHSLVAHLTAEGPKVIPNAVGDSLTPSVVGVDEENRLLVGESAKELQIVRPERCAALFKRYMGGDWTTTIAGRKFTPPELSAIVLRSLKQDAEAHLGGPIERAVITVPAYFNEHQRQATLEAGRLAGFTVERIVNEPTAAALAYGFHEAAQDKILLVFDLGGGTFDVSLVELFAGAVEVRASAGEAFLGGEDFTRALAAQVLQRHGQSFERAEIQSPRLISRLVHQCERAKRQLSSAPTATVRVPKADGSLDDDCPQMVVTREDFTKWTGYVLARCEGPIRRVLGDAKMNRADVGEVILVGGATRMPSVFDMVAERFGKPPHRRLHPDEVVALGAAVQAGLIADDKAVEDLVVTDVCPFTLGIEISKEFGRDHRSGYFSPIIERNTTLPVSRQERYQTAAPNQTEMHIAIYQGESRMVEQNLLLGELMVRALPRGPAGSQSVDVRFTYDLNGVLEVECTVVETGKKAVQVVTRHAKGLTPKQIEAAVRQMESLKTHPRDESTNRLLLRRAERVFQELPVEERSRLSSLLDGWEQVMDGGDKEAIEKYRAAVTEFLDRFESGDRDGEDGDDWYKP